MSILTISTIKTDISGCCRQLRDAGASQTGVMVTQLLFTASTGARIADGVQIWITDTALSLPRPGRARVVPLAPLLTGNVG